MTTSTDRIEKEIVLRAPRARVWRALTDAAEFGRWFGVLLHGSFAVGSTISGRITSSGYENLLLEMTIERMEPESRFAWRWHPHAVDPSADYSQEPMTLVEFSLEDVAEGTLLRVVESGFERIPLERRVLALRMNTEGWEVELGNVAKHVDNG